jgi:hypothetical protein
MSQKKYEFEVDLKTPYKYEDMKYIKEGVITEGIIVLAGSNNATFWSDRVTRWYDKVSQTELLQKDRVDFDVLFSHGCFEECVAKTCALLKKTLPQNYPNTDIVIHLYIDIRETTYKIPEL